jgi:ubiquitin-conjugating enzyme E2 variant
VLGIDRQPPARTLAKGVAVATSIVLATLVGWRLVFSVRTGGDIVCLVTGLLVGYLAADLFSGTVHWFCDTFFGEDTPVIGRVLIQPFRDHHRRPDAIADYRLLEQDASSAFLLLAPLWLVSRGGGPRPDAALGLIAHAAFWAFAICALATNLFHKWAHAPRPPLPGRFLQRCGLILSPRAHAVHHSGYTHGFCVTSGRLNPLLDRIRFFARLERLVRSFVREPLGDRQ